MTKEQPSFGARWSAARIERLYSCPNDAAMNYAAVVGAIRPRWWSAAGSFESAAMRVVTLRAILTRVPTVLLHAEPQERYRTRLWLPCPYTRLSIRSLVGASPLANAPSNRTRKTCRRECSRRMSRGRAPPVQASLAAAPQSSQIRPQRQARTQDGGTAQPHILPHPARRSPGVGQILRLL